MVNALTATVARAAVAKRNEKKEEEEEEEEEELRAELLCAQEHFQKCVEHEDYRGAAAAKDNIDALTLVVARADRHISRTMTAQCVV